MPKKLTKDQKYNQKLRKEGQKDFKRVPREGKTASMRVTRRALCVRVSTETTERLKTMADDAGVAGQMLVEPLSDAISDNIIFPLMEKALGKDIPSAAEIHRRQQQSEQVRSSWYTEAVESYKTPAEGSANSSHTP